MIGPSFSNELHAAGLSGLPFTWRETGEFTFDPAMTAEHIAAVESIYAAHDPAKPDPRQTYSAAIAAGLAVVSAGAPAMSGTYGLTSQDEINVTGLQVAVSAGVFPGYCRDIAGTKHTMTAAQFTALATAILNYIATLDEARDTALSGGTATWPTSPVTIA